MFQIKLIHNGWICRDRVLHPKTQLVLVNLRSRVRGFRWNQPPETPPPLSSTIMPYPLFFPQRTCTFAPLASFTHLVRHAPHWHHPAFWCLPHIIFGLIVITCYYLLDLPTTIHPQPNEIERSNCWSKRISINTFFNPSLVWKKFELI